MKIQHQKTVQELVAGLIENVAQNVELGLDMPSEKLLPILGRIAQLLDMNSRTETRFKRFNVIVEAYQKGENVLEAHKNTFHNRIGIKDK